VRFRERLKPWLPQTIAARIFLLTSLFSLIGVAVIAVVISNEYRRSAENQLSELLTANLFNLMGSVEQTRAGQLRGEPLLGEPRYALIDSGFYWSIQKLGGEQRIVSPSLAGKRIETPAGVLFDPTFQRRFETNDWGNRMLSGLEAQVYLGDGNDLYSFRITANREELEADIANFRQRLAITLSAFALLIVLATYFAVRYGMKPVQRATANLQRVREGDAERIEGSYPEEIEPLITEANALIASNNTIVERARTQVGNLAHSLKTPLAVMRNEVPNLSKQRGVLFFEQLDEMGSQIQVYLDRARISARSSTAIARTPVVPVLQKLVNVVQKLSGGMSIAFEAQGSQPLIFEGEEHDLQEIFGNLIENAAKYANSQVSVIAKGQVEKLIVTIEDDGCGMSEEQIAKAMQRGGRVDEGKTGWGLGLSIVRDIVEEYSGEFSLARSSLGGLSATVILPRRVPRTEQS